MSPKATRAVQEAARRIVRARDAHYCQMCGVSIVDIESSIHHRLNKGNGGSALLERPSVLIRLCGSGTTRCHGWIGRNPEKAGDLGWLLPRNNPDIDPEREPIFTIRGWLLLDDEGARTACDPRPGVDVRTHRGSAPRRIPQVGEASA